MARRLSLIFVILSLFVFASIPVSAIEQQTEQSIGSIVPDSKAPVKDDVLSSPSIDINNPPIVEELVERRKSNEKTYLLEDGTMLLEIHQNDIHYVDFAGKLQDIKTDLVDEADLTAAPLKTDSVESQKRFDAAKAKKKKIANQTALKEESAFTTLQTPFSVDIPKKFAKGYGIEQGGKQLRFIPVQANVSSKAVRDMKEANKVVYKNAWMNTDVELLVVNEGIKENIILKNAKTPKSFSFEVQGNLEEFHLAPAWLEDAEGTVRDVAMTKRTANGKNYIDLTWDSAGLKYPVLIDPTVYGTLSRFASVNMGSAFTMGSDKLAVGGKKSAAGFTETYRSYLEFSFDPSRLGIQGAYLRVFRGGYREQSNTSYVDFQPVHAYGTWVDPMTDSNKLGILGGGAGRPVYRYNFHTGTTAVPYYILDVYSYLSGISQGNVRLGLIAVNSDAQYSGNQSSEAVIQLTSPTLYVNFIDTLPTTPLELKASNVTATGLTLNWKASTYDHGIASYQISQNGSVVASTTSLNATINNLSIGNLYRFSIRAKGSDGKLSKESSEVVYINKVNAAYVYFYSTDGKLDRIDIHIGSTTYYQYYYYDKNGNLIKITTSKS